MSLPRLLAWIGETRKADIAAGVQLAQSYFAAPLPHTGGSTAGVRIAHRLALGATVEQAAAKEYLYRWRLTLDRSPTPSVRVYNTGAFGVPHLLGA